MQKSRKIMRKIKGIPVSPGIAIARVTMLGGQDVLIRKTRLTADEIAGEIARFEDALTKTRSELLMLRKRISKEMGREHSDIFNAHLLILEDRTLIEEVITSLRQDMVNVESAFSEIMNRYTQAFMQIDDGYLKERISDIRDIGRRVLNNLSGAKKESPQNATEPIIVVAHDLTPSETVQMNKKIVAGFLTDVGGPTSHVAILARSLELPAIVGLRHITSEVKDGDEVIIDGSTGVVVISPTTKEIAAYRKKGKKFEQVIQKLSEIKDLPAVTSDNHAVELAANIEFPSEIGSVLLNGGSGIGLYRTEYIFMNRFDLPTEEEQYQAYRSVVEKMGKAPVVLRTLDLGGDKFSAALKIPGELNSFLGWRAIRFCLERMDIFKTQLRAILRASCHGNLKVMFPMISNVGEVQSAKRVLEEVKAELKKEKIAFNDDMDVGVMIEVPSAALTSDILAVEVDFFSIGSNDLIQYSLAVDRGNEKIAHLYQPTHPAILRLIKQVVENGHKHSIWVGVCGEMAGDPALVPLLLGLGIDELSVSAVVVPIVKNVIRSVSVRKTREIAAHCLALRTGEEIREYLEKQLALLIKN